MTISQYWVGQIPSRPIAIEVRDSNGNPANLSSYSNYVIHVFDTNDDEVDLTGATLTTTGADTGRLVFRWPVGRSVFDRSGDYLLQLEVDGTGTKDFTTIHTIKVKKQGGRY